MTFLGKIVMYLRGMRMLERFSPARTSMWACSLQTEHLLAYATWDEMLFDPEETGEGDAHPWLGGFPLLYERILARNW